MIIPANAFDPPEDSRDKPLSKECRGELSRYLREHDLAAIILSNPLNDFIRNRAKEQNISPEQWIIDAVNLHARRL